MGKNIHPIYFNLLKLWDGKITEGLAFGSEICYCFQCMKTMAENYMEVIDEIVKRVVEKVNPLKIILFGSYAYGSPTQDSDIDLMVIKESSVPRHRRSKEIRSILRGMKVALDIIVYTPEEIKKWEGIDTAFITGVLKKGKVLFGSQARVEV